MLLEQGSRAAAAAQGDVRGAHRRVAIPRAAELRVQQLALAYHLELACARVAVCVIAAASSFLLAPT